MKTVDEAVAVVIAVGDGEVDQAAIDKITDLQGRYREIAADVMNNPLLMLMVEGLAKMGHCTCMGCRMAAIKTGIINGVIIGIEMEKAE
jgi:hypothetical protein